MIKYINFEMKLWGPFKNFQKFVKTFVKIFRMGIMEKFIYLIIVIIMFDSKDKKT